MLLSVCVAAGCVSVIAAVHNQMNDAGVWLCASLLAGNAANDKRDG